MRIRGERKEGGPENRELPKFGGFTRRAWRSSDLFLITAAVICLPVGLSTQIESLERSLLTMDSAGPSISYTPAHGTKSGERVESQDSNDGNAVSQNTVAEARLRSVVVEIRGVIFWSRSQDGRCDGMD